ncbi:MULTISPECIES: nitroreductase family protein [unclassified Haloarcula]|uniref:nitroreductase family protein n=1 Tax=unclassified Haloarcula TaxID=2624677 RepID=UPI001246CB65|nr:MULTISPECIES: nitroreductase family protein [unclassified Haloarcula]KAA9404463.1 nitroreductase [Haloarcula sp. CBA1131]MUV48248.1 nitroreductase [Haloarcula sp. CBA1122]
MSQTYHSRSLDDEISEHRDPAHDVDPLFVNRWSPRAMAGDSLAEDDLLPLFEAARWAPSAFNNQHWRFVYATREDDEWESFLGLLNEANRSWARNAGALIAVFSKVTLEHNGESAGTRSFDTGAAWQNLALEGARRDLAVHPMAGFDWDRIHEALGVPEDEFDAEAMIAVGERADPETLPEDLKEHEKPSGRKPLDEIVFSGQFE